ncbi:MAG: hypothetical protein IT307_09380, partial [Chloroflexi bacterium]|nr:hypothetical protein [Chloroflexota bacterium]
MMKGFLRAVAVTATAMALVLGVGVLAVRAGVLGPLAAHAAPMGPFGDMPAELQWLKDLTPAERFLHFYSGQLRFSDQNNQVHTVAMTPGTVTDASSSSLKIKTNDTGDVKSYNLTSDTRIRRGPQRIGDSATPKSGDQVVVV